MPRFTYTAVNAKGEEEAGVLDARTRKEADDLLHQRGLFPTHLFEEGKVSKPVQEATSWTEPHPAAKRILDNNPAGCGCGCLSLPFLVLGLICLMSAVFNMDRVVLGETKYERAIYRRGNYVEVWRSGPLGRTPDRTRDATVDERVFGGVLGILMIGAFAACVWIGMRIDKTKRAEARGRKQL